MKKTIASFTLVKNEEDVIETFIRHTLLYVDQMFIANNLSSDGTEKILNRLVDEGLPIIVYKDNELAHNQSKKTTRYLHDIHRKYKHSVYFFLDADEFIVFDKKCLDLSPGAFYIERKDCYFTAECDESILAWRNNVNYNKVKNATPKSCLVSVDDVSLIRVGEGSHYIYRNSQNISESYVANATIYHVPIRSSNQYTKKNVLGWFSMMAKSPNVNKEEKPIGGHWRTEYHKILKSNFNLSGVSLERHLYRQPVDSIEKKEFLPIDFSSTPLLYEDEVVKSNPSTLMARSFEDVIGLYWSRVKSDSLSPEYFSNQLNLALETREHQARKVWIYNGKVCVVDLAIGNIKVAIDIAPKDSGYLDITIFLRGEHSKNIQLLKSSLEATEWLFCMSKSSNRYILSRNDNIISAHLWVFHLKELIVHLENSGSLLLSEAKNNEQACKADVNIETLLPSWKKTFLEKKGVKKVWLYKRKALVVDLEVKGNKIAFDTTLSKGGDDFETWLFSRNSPDSLDFLDSQSIKTKEHKYLVHKGSARDQGAVIEAIDKYVDYLQGFKAPAIKLFFWDLKKNFGDKIGPFLVEKMANKETINIFQREEEAEGLLVVGSIIGLLDRPGLDIWGSGLIRPLSAAQAKKLQAFPPRKILAVRGYKTYSQLREKLGWDVPKVLGDPALLLPKYFTPAVSESSTHGKIAIIPHYSHASLFKHLHNEDSLRVLNVADEPLEVINDIATAEVCLSTSLHGIVVAHAYGVPWVWLQITDNQLRGDTFKFEDFFTVLDRSTVSHKALTKQDVQGMTKSSVSEIASSAALPTNKFDFTDLENALLNHIAN